MRRCLLDPRQVPDQSEEEFKSSVREFLWPPRLRKEKTGPDDR
jgi:hypothetical protein